MMHRLYRATLFATYQLTVTLGILVMPLALLFRQMGVSLPVHRLIEATGSAYEDAAETTVTS